MSSGKTINSKSRAREPDVLGMWESWVETALPMSLSASGWVLSGQTLVS